MDTYTTDCDTRLNDETILPAGSTGTVTTVYEDSADVTFAGGLVLNIALADMDNDL